MVTRRNTFPPTRWPPPTLYAAFLARARSWRRSPLVLGRDQDFLVQLRCVVPREVLRGFTSSVTVAGTRGAHHPPKRTCKCAAPVSVQLYYTPCLITQLLVQQNKTINHKKMLGHVHNTTALIFPRRVIRLLERACAMPRCWTPSNAPR